MQIPLNLFSVKLIVVQYFFSCISDTVAVAAAHKTQFMVTVLAMMLLIIRFKLKSFRREAKMPWS